VYDFEDTGDQEGRRKLVASPYRWRDPAEIPRRSWLYGRHYIRKFTSATIAPGGLAKTSLVLVEAVAIALNRPLLGIMPTEQTNVWIWNGEDPAEEIERRIAAICQNYEIDGRELEGRLFLNSGRVDPIKLAAVTRGVLALDGQLQDNIAATIAENEIGLSIFDPFISTHTVPESDNTNVDAVW
jgi:RecA-family ATPase